MIPAALVEQRQARPGGRGRRCPRPPRDLGPHDLARAAQGSRRERGACCRTSCSQARLITFPVLAEEVREALAVRPGETVVDATFGAGGHARLLAADLQRLGQAHRDRPRPGASSRTSSASAAARASRRASCAASFATVLQQLAANGGGGRRDPARPRRLEHAARPARARLLVRGRRTARHAHGPLRRGVGARARERARRSASCETIFHRYGEERYAKQIARAIARRRRRAPVRADGPSSSTRSSAAIPAPARFGDGHPAKRVFQALRIAVNDELRPARGGAAGGVRDAAARRPPRGDQLPLARGPDRQDVSAATASAAASARPTSPSASAATSRCCASLKRRPVRPIRDEIARQPARRLGAPPRGGEGIAMAAWSSAARNEETAVVRARPRPQARPRPAARERRIAGGVVWIVAPRRPARGRRRDERRRAAAEHGPRPPRPRARRPDRRERCAGGPALERGRGAEDPGARAGEARLRPRDRRTRLPTWSSGRAHGEPEAGQPPDPPAPRTSRPRLRRNSRACGLAPGSAGGVAVAHGRVPAPRDGCDPGRARDDLRPHRRPARDRRAGDDGLRRTRCRSQDPRAVARVAGRRSESTPRTLYPQARRSLAWLRLRRAQGRPREGVGTGQEAASAASASTPRSGVPTRRARSPRRCSVTRGSTTTASSGLELQLDKTLSGTARQGDDRQGPVRPRDRRRQPDAGARRARRRSSRSITRSRRTPSSSCARPSSSGARRAPQRSCSIRTRGRCSRWRCSPATTRTGSRTCPRACSATTP